MKCTVIITSRVQCANSAFESTLNSAIVSYRFNKLVHKNVHRAGVLHHKLGLDCAVFYVTSNTGRRFLQVKRPNQQYQSTEGESCKGKQHKNTNTGGRAQFLNGISAQCYTVPIKLDVVKKI